MMKKPVMRRVAFACMAAAPIAAQAQLSYPAEKWWDSRWYIAPFGSYTLSDNDRRADDGWGGGISIGKAIHPSWDLELRGAYEELDADGAPPNGRTTHSASTPSGTSWQGRPRALEKSAVLQRGWRRRYQGRGRRKRRVERHGQCRTWGGVAARQLGSTLSRRPLSLGQQPRRPRQRQARLTAGSLA